MKRVIRGLINQIRSRLTIEPTKNSNIFDTINQSRVIQSRADPIKETKDPLHQISLMSTIQELERQKKVLEDRVHELVEILESKKSSDKIRLTKTQIIKSQEEQDASAALEKLAIADEQAASKKTEQKSVEVKKKAPKQKGGAAAKEPEKPIDISRLDLRIGKIVDVERHPDADALYVEKIDCGDASGPRTVISGLVKHVPIEDMKERLVVVLCNLKPVKMRGIVSEAMVMCASSDDGVEILGVPTGVNPGDRVVFSNYPGEPDELLNPKKKIWEQVSPDIKTNDQGIAVYKDSEFAVIGRDGKFTSKFKNVQVR